MQTAHRSVRWRRAFAAAAAVCVVHVSAGLCFLGVFAESVGGFGLRGKALVVGFDVFEFEQLGLFVDFFLAVVVVAGAASDVGVEVSVGALVQREAHEHIDEHAESRGPHHGDGVEDFWGVEEADEGFVEESESEDPDEHDAGQRAEGLCPVVAEGVVAVDPC